MKKSIQILEVSYKIVLPKTLPEKTFVDNALAEAHFTENSFTMASFIFLCSSNNVMDGRSFLIGKQIGSAC